MTEKIRPVSSLAAWGTISCDYPIKGTVKFHRLDGGIMIEVDENGEFEISISFCNPSDVFTKKKAYGLLRSKMKYKKLAFRGKYSGDKPISEFVNPTMKFFKFLIERISSGFKYRSSFREGKKNVLIAYRGSQDTMVILKLLHDYLNSKKSITSLTTDHESFPGFNGDLYLDITRMIQIGLIK